MTTWSKLKQKFTKTPESSVTLRLLVLAAMFSPLLALVRVRPALLPYAVLAALGMMLGHWYSYHSRHNPSKLMRLIMFIGIHLALCWMFFAFAIGATVPQAQFAIFAQAITSFDLRYRTSLFNTLIHSLANLYVAATLSRTTEFGLYLLLFGGLALAAFFVAARDSGLADARLTPDTDTRPNQPSSARPLTLFGLSFGGLLLTGVFVLFLLTPRYSNRPFVPPFSLNLPLSGGTSSEIINPGVPLVQVNGWNDGVGDYYYGFDTNLDLRYRGGLSDEIVMYVRSPSRSYWRSHSYDYYDGITWQQADKQLTNYEGAGVYFELPAPLGSPEAEQQWGRRRLDGQLELPHPPGRPRHFQEMFDDDNDDVGVALADTGWRDDQQIVQTFNIVRNLPNLLFAAYRPAEFFMSTERISLDRYGGIRLPESLQAGMTYSVVSYRPDFDPDVLRRTPPSGYPADVSRRYLQLPPNISDRVKRLAQSLARPHNNNFDKVRAINNHLLSEYPYNYFPPPHPPGAEVVDTFLFVDKEGVCEQYVTALVVMARSLGIPARLTAGYGSGQYNPVTGYYEVRYSDAHAWAEVYFPGHGWVPFDPTPGWTPQPYPTPAQNWLFANNGQLLGQLTGLNLPVSGLASGLMAGLAFFAPFVLGSALLVGLVLLLVYLFRRWQARQRNRPRGYSSLAADHPARRLILQTYRQGCRLLARRQPPRQAAETVAEYARRLEQLPAFGRLSRLAEAAAYRPQPPSEDGVQQARTALGEVKQALKKRRKNR